MTDESAAEDFTPVAVTLRGGRRATLRAIRPDDREALQAAMGRLSGEARYMRFMGAIKELSPSMLDRAVNPVTGRDLALVALADGADTPGAADNGTAGSIVAGARYITGPDLQTCEFAIAVADDWCGMGLASRLMNELIRSARSRGLKGMEGFILSGNTPMRNLAKRLGFEVTVDGGEPGVVRVWLDLQSGKFGGARGGTSPA